MPSLWKKQRGNRISRLVNDLQTPSKRGGSLVVETGFPTSLIDLFVKNRDKLKKPKNKKHKSKKLTTVSEDYDDSDHQKALVSHPPCASFCELDVPRCSIVSNCEQKVDNFEDKVANNDLCVENEVAHETSVEEIYHDCCEIEEERQEIVEVFNSRNYVLLSILTGALIFGVVLYAKNGFLALITLGFLLLMLLEYIGNLRYGLLKNCENGVWMWKLKGSLVVLVALSTKWFVVGITIGACLLILLDYVGNSIFGFFKPCQDAKGILQGILPNWGDSNSNKLKKEFSERRRKGERGNLTRAILIGSKMEVPSDGKNDLVSRRYFEDEQDGNKVILSREIEPGCVCGLVSGRGVEDDEIVPALKEVRDSSLCNENSSLLVEEKQRESIYEPLALESNDFKDPKSSDVSGSVGCIDLQGEKGASGRREERCEDFKLVTHDGKIKKNTKFWKKLVPKKKSSKRKKHEHGGEISVAHMDNSTRGSTRYASNLVEVDEQGEDEREIIEEGLSISISRSRSMPSLTEEDEGRVDKFEGGNGNDSITERLQLDNKNSRSCVMVMEGYGNMKFLSAMVIPLTGLIGGRMLAVVVTVICCLVFKMVRS